MKLLIAAALLVLTSSCASIIVKEQARKVRFVTTTPHSCRYLGQIEAYWRDSKTGGLVWSEESKPPFTRADLKNKAADIGADTIEVTSAVNSRATAESYYCGTSELPPPKMKKPIVDSASDE